MQRLLNKVAIITGAAAGIGAGTAEVFAEEGAKLVLVDRDQAALATICDRLSAINPDIVACLGDVADRKTAERAVQLAVGSFGGIDVLFNNAGIMTYGDFTELTDEGWDSLLSINLRGFYLFSHAVVPKMLERGGGAIVNTSSAMAWVTEPGYEAYTTSKAGIIGLTKALAVSYAEQGIRANAILPGWVDTPLNQRLAEGLGGLDKLTPIIKQQQPLPRMISPREIG